MQQFMTQMGTLMTQPVALEAAKGSGGVSQAAQSSPPAAPAVQSPDSDGSVADLQPGPPGALRATPGSTPGADANGPGEGVGSAGGPLQRSADVAPCEEATLLRGSVSTYP